MVERCTVTLTRKAPPALVIGSYATIYLVWGSTYFFIRQSVLTIPPMWVLAIRWLIGGALLLAAAGVRGGLRALPSWRAVLSSIVLGTFLLLGGNGLMTIAERHIESYVAALLASSTPIVVAVIDSVLLRKPLTVARVLGVVFGIVGVAVLLYNGQSVASSLNVSVLLGLAGILSWGLATSLAHRFPVSGDNTVSSGIQMLFVGVVSAAVCAITGPAPSAVLARASTLSLVSVIYLGVLGSLAFSAYAWLVQVEPAERVVSYALVNPVIALFIGLAFGGETATPYLGAGVAVVLVGLAFMLYGERLLTWRRRRDRSAE
ncbi:MAG TPA: EamA family transporter [Spirochaetia bacterium]|nr:EamA family transporter [Spirochaetia bacterium]